MKQLRDLILMRSGLGVGLVVLFVRTASASGPERARQFGIHDPVYDNMTPPHFCALDDIDTAYPEHPVFEWVECRGRGTRLNLNDDQTVHLLLPGNFGFWKFYGQIYGDISICSNGWIAPGWTDAYNYNNLQLPSPALPTPAVCPNWDDLNPTLGGGVWWFYDEPNHRFVVEFDSVAYFSPPNVYDKFELVIYDLASHPGYAENQFVCQYLTANSTSSATIGIQDNTERYGITCLVNGSYHENAAPIAPGRAIKYTMTETGLREQDEGRALVAASLLVQPNPAAGPVRVAYRLSRPGPARLQLVDASGRSLKTLRLGISWSGSVVLETEDLRPGIYWLRLEGLLTSAASRLVVCP